MTMNELVNSLNLLLAELQSKSDSLPSKMSYYDAQQQDLLHYVENSKLSASQMSQLIKKLREIRECRREVKDEYAALCHILSKIPANQIQLPALSTSYEVRTDALEFLGLERKQKMDLPERAEKNSRVPEEVPEFTPEETIADDVDDIEALKDGKKVRVTNVANGTSVTCNHFETACWHVFAAQKKNTKCLCKEHITNMVGIARALRLGHEYMGYRFQWVE